jgi:phytol kinase
MNLMESLILLPLPVLLPGMLAGLAWSYGCLRFAGYLRCSCRLPGGYTRKVFHLLIFSTVACLHLAWGLAAVCLFGASTSLTLAYAVHRGAGYPLYEAIARESDRPHRTYYVVVPYFATLIGGLLSNYLFGSFAMIGYLVGGIGDAAGEPVGTKWGKHRYRVSWLGAGTKTFEGSAGVLLASLLVLLVGIGLNPTYRFGWHSLAAVAGIALICSVIEAAAPRGWDNTPMQVVPAFLAFLLLRS